MELLSSYLALGPKEGSLLLNLPGHRWQQYSDVTECRITLFPGEGVLKWPSTYSPLAFVSLPPQQTREGNFLVPCQLMSDDISHSTPWFIVFLAMWLRLVQSYASWGSSVLPTAKQGHASAKYSQWQQAQVWRKNGQCYEGHFRRNRFTKNVKSGSDFPEVLIKTFSVFHCLSSVILRNFR